MPLIPAAAMVLQRCPYSGKISDQAQKIKERKQAGTPCARIKENTGSGNKSGFEPDISSVSVSQKNAYVNIIRISKRIIARLLKIFLIHYASVHHCQPSLYISYIVNGAVKYIIR